MYSLQQRTGKQLFASVPRPSTMTTVRHYNFASVEYASCFGKLERIDSAKLRKDSVERLRVFDHQKWFADPMVTVLKGVRHTNGIEVVTKDAFDKDNGKQVQSPPEVIDAVIKHMQTYKAPKIDYRAEVRAVEQKLLHSSPYNADLVVNQAVDFYKQDGITEMEESAEANTVERRLNDLLLRDEAAGVIAVNRAPALIGCVSNFSNFLDLFRKTIRNLEVGVPCVVFSRSNTTQHHYRWFVMLQTLLQEHNVDKGMVSFVSSDIHQQRRIIQANQDSPLYFTGSRPISQAIKNICPKLMSSTGGPNTLVSTVWTPSIAQAVSWSASIEHSGQCTALRHLVVPPNTATVGDVLKIISKVQAPVDSLAVGGFAAVFDGVQTFTNEEGYTVDHTIPAAVKVSPNFPGDDLDEKWRQVYIDVTETKFDEPQFSNALSKWLVHHCPISLAVNGEDFPSSFKLARTMFEKTSLVVYTVGSSGSPALTAQARPQDGEIFGEFPPRHLLTKYTKFPVVGPGSSASLNSTYTHKYLLDQSCQPLPPGYDYADVLIAMCSDVLTRGYLKVMLNYLTEAAQGPRVGGDRRTALWGLQRPPLIDNGFTVLRVCATTKFDDVMLVAIPFIVTNARSQLIVSVHPNNPDRQKFAHLQEFVNVIVEDDGAYSVSCDVSKPWNVLTPVNNNHEYPLVGAAVTLLFPLGHIKCTKPKDEQFLSYFKQSKKWLKVLPYWASRKF